MFRVDADDRGLAEHWYELETGEAKPENQRITVPFAPHSELSGVDGFARGEPGGRDVVWYARTLPPVRLPAGHRLMLRFGAVDYRATVWVNGVQVAEHVGGHTPFSADITDVLGIRAENIRPVGNSPETMSVDATSIVDVVVVRAEDRLAALDVPRGKQYWLPESEGIFYTPTIGIWQSVWLEPVPAAHFSDIQFSPDVPSGTAEVTAAIETTQTMAPGATVELAVTLDGRPITIETGPARPDFRHRLTLRRPDLPAPNGDVGHWDGVALWSPENPRLYDVRLTLRDADGSVIDTVDSYLGMRSIATDGDQVLLNGRPYFQRLVLDQGYFPGGVLTAPSDDDLRRDIELAKELGFNGARKHQKVEDPRWLYWADRLGFLVWGEMANAYAYSPDYVRRITDEWQQVVRRDRSHPCVVAWVPMNESWGVPHLANDSRQRAHLNALVQLTRSLDDGRLVISNDGWEHADSDLFTVHDYRDPETIARQYASRADAIAARPAGVPGFVPGHRYDGQPILVTECGGMAFVTDAGGWGYSTVEGAEEFLDHYRRLIGALVSSPVVRGFCYTQLTDVEQETNGLLTFDRVPKADRDRIREITSLPS